MFKFPLKRGSIGYPHWLLIAGVLLVTFSLVLTACQTETPAPTEPPVEPTEALPEPTEAPPEPTEVPPEPTAVPPPDQSAYYEAVTGNMMNTYDLGHGPNTWCTRCHSPQNWDPAAFQGPPPTCFTCKFAHEEEMRVAEGNPFVPEEEWVGVPCETCHDMSLGYSTGEMAWLNPITMEYQAVATSTELCEKCHVTTTGNAFGSAVDHKITLGGSAHLNYGGFLGDTPPPQYCADCHDPHTLTPKQCVDCHEFDSTTHAQGFYPMMEIVTCMACHDASGLDVGPHPDEEMGGIWVTQVTTMGRGGPETEFVLSHSIVYEVSCDKCHFEENPWGLIVLNADGSVPETEE